MNVWKSKSIHKCGGDALLLHLAQDLLRLLSHRRPRGDCPLNRAARHQQGQVDAHGHDHEQREVLPESRYPLKSLMGKWRITSELENNMIRNLSMTRSQSLYLINTVARESLFELSGDHTGLWPLISCWAGAPLRSSSRTTAPPQTLTKEKGETFTEKGEKTWSAWLCKEHFPPISRCKSRMNISILKFLTKSACIAANTVESSCWISWRLNAVKTHTIQSCDLPLKY